MPRLNAKHSHLLVLDLQERYLPLMCSDHQAPLLRAAQILGATAEAFSLPTTVSEHIPQLFGETAAAISTALAPAQPQRISKTSFSLAGLPDLAEALHSAHDILLMGIEAHICVLQTGRDLLEAGHRVHLISDGISAKTEALKEQACAELYRQGAHFHTAEGLAFELLGDAKHPAAEKLSRLVMGS